MISRYRCLAALCAMFFALGAVPAGAQPAFPLLDGIWSANCDSGQDFVLRYLRNNAAGANYAVVQYQAKRESMKASGFARYDSGSGTWILVDNFISASKRTGQRENVLRVAPGGGSYTVVSARIDGQPIITNGTEVRTGQAVPPRRRCGADSAAASAVPTWEETRAMTDRLPFPQPPDNAQQASGGGAERPAAQTAQRPPAAAARETADSGKPTMVAAVAVNDIIAEPGRYVGRTVAVGCDSLWRSSNARSITCDSSNGNEIDIDPGSLDRGSFRYVLERCGNNDQCSACAVGQLARSGKSLVLKNGRLHWMFFGQCMLEQTLGN